MKRLLPPALVLLAFLEPAWAGPRRDPIALDSLIKPLAAVGFKLQKRPAKAAIPSWDSATYGTRARWTASFKSTFKSPLGGRHYYRIWIDEEHFATTEAAQARAEASLVAPPGLGGEARKVFPLRRSFAEGPKVFTVRTDVAAYGNKLNTFAQGVARLRETQSGPALDSLKAEFRRVE